MSLLAGKKVVVMGVANKRSIAWGCAKALMEQGAEVIYTYQNERMKKQLDKLVPAGTFLVEADAASDESLANAFATIGEYAGEIHGVIHAIAYANKEDLSGDILAISMKDSLWPKTSVPIPLSPRRNTQNHTWQKTVVW